VESPVPARGIWAIRHALHPSLIQKEFGGIRAYTGSRINLGPQFLSFVFWRIFENGHIYIFSFSFKVILIISSGKFSNEKQVDTSFNSETKPPKIFFCRKDRKNIFSSNVLFGEWGLNKFAPQKQSGGWISVTQNTYSPFQKTRYSVRVCVCLIFEFNSPEQTSAGYRQCDDSWLEVQLACWRLIKATERCAL